MSLCRASPPVVAPGGGCDMNQDPARVPDGAAAAVSAPAVSSDPRSQLLLQGSLWKALAALAWPLFITMIATSFAGFADAYVAGRINSAAQAAIGIGDVVW